MLPKGVVERVVKESQSDDPLNEAIDERAGEGDSEAGDCTVLLLPDEGSSFARSPSVLRV